MPELFLQSLIKMVLFHFSLYNLNENWIYLSFLITFLNYIRFFFLISFNKISILILFHLYLSMYNFLYSILRIHYSGKVRNSFMKTKKGYVVPYTAPFILFIYSIDILRIVSKRVEQLKKLMNIFGFKAFLFSMNITCCL